MGDPSLCSPLQMPGGRLSDDALCVLSQVSFFPRSAARTRDFLTRELFVYISSFYPVRSNLADLSDPATWQHAFDQLR